MTTKILTIFVTSLIISTFFIYFVLNILADYIGKSYDRYDMEKVYFNILKQTRTLSEFDEDVIKNIILDEKKKNNDLNFRLIDLKGKFYYSTIDMNNKDKHEYSIEDLEKMLEEKINKKVKFIDFFDKRDNSFVGPMIINDEQVGTLFVTVKGEKSLPFYIRINKDRMFYIYFVIFTVIISVILISYLLVVILTVPMVNRFKKIFHMVENFSPDNMTPIVEDNKNDEIGHLTRTFNLMIAKINQYNDEQKKYYRDKQNIFSEISHDFRTPLTAILGYATYLDEELYDGEEDLKVYYKNIRRRAEYMKRLFNELMELSRLDSEVMILKNEKFNIAELVREIVIEYIPKFEEQDFVYDIDIQDTIIFNGDKNRLSRVVRNLIDNVLKHAATGKYINIAVFDSQGKIIVVIKDKGLGIKVENKENIFYRFYKGRVKDGMGLGLVIVKSIVEKHNGTISVDSDADNGTTFYIELPDQSAESK